MRAERRPTALRQPGPAGAPMRWAAIALLWLLAGCRGGETPVLTTQFVAFDGAVDVSIVGMLKQEALDAGAEVERDMLFLSNTLHAWEPGPMVRVNELLARGEPFAAPPSILPLIRRSQALAVQSENLFNPAIGHLMRLWGFHTDEPECRPPPSRRSIERLVGAAPTVADVYIDGIMLQSDNPAVSLDFSAIALGYAMDLAIDSLRDRGVRSAMINAGGNVRVIGDRAGRPWRIPIRRATGGGVLAILTVSGDASVFTSSDYARNFIYEGKTYHAVIDPRTGYPADGIHAATVLHNGSAALADAASTALMVAGVSGWREIAERMGVDYALLIDDAGTLHMTPAMAERIQILDHDADIAIAAPAAEATAER